jgi:hypothetical protein
MKIHVYIYVIFLPLFLRTTISGPINFTHVQHFGPYESLNPEDMPDAGTATGGGLEYGDSLSGPSPSIQSLSAIQAGSGGPHNRKNNARESFGEAFNSNTDRYSAGDMSALFEKYDYNSGGLGAFLDENGQ